MISGGLLSCGNISRGLSWLGGHLRSMGNDEALEGSKHAKELRRNLYLLRLEVSLCSYSGGNRGCVVSIEKIHGNIKHLVEHRAPVLRDGFDLMN
jgi:hypothetical protein